MQQTDDGHPKAYWTAAAILERLLDRYRTWMGLDADDGLEPVELLHEIERVSRREDPTCKLRVLPEDRR